MLDSNRSLSKWFHGLPGRARAIGASFTTEATADTLQSGENGDALSSPVDDGSYLLGRPPKAGDSDEAPSAAPKLLPEARQAAFDKFLQSQGADRWQHFQNSKKGGGMSRAFPESSQGSDRSEEPNSSNSETGGLLSSGSSPISPPGKIAATKEGSDCFEPKLPIFSNDIEDRFSAVPQSEQVGGGDETSNDECQSGRDQHSRPRRSASLSVSRRPVSGAGLKLSHCDGTSIVEYQSGREVHRRSRRSASLSASRHPISFPSAIPEQSHHNHDQQGAGVCNKASISEHKPRGEERRSSRRTAPSPLPRRPSTSSVSTLSMSTSHRRGPAGLRRSRSYSRSRYSWAVPRFRRSRSRMAKEPVAPKKFDAQEEEVPVDFGSSPSVAPRQKKERLRSRSYSLSRRYYAACTDGMTQKMRLRNYSSSQLRHYSKDTDDHVDRATGRAEHEEEASYSANEGPTMWVSFQTLEDVADDETASANELGEALAMIEDAQSENASLRRSVAEATELARATGEKLEDLARAHEASVRDYEGRLDGMNERSRRREEELLARLDAVREENESLRAVLVAGEGGRRRPVREGANGGESVGRVALEREDARRARRALRREARALQRALGKQSGRDNGRPPTSIEGTGSSE